MDDATSDRFEESGAVKWLRILGQLLSAVREHYDGYRPVAGDPAGVALGKNVVRYGSVVTVGSLGVVVGGMAAVHCL
jgi:hypothetical protein